MKKLDERIEYYTHSTMPCWTEREQLIVDCLKDVKKEMMARAAKNKILVKEASELLDLSDYPTCYFDPDEFKAMMRKLISIV